MPHQNRALVFSIDDHYVMPFEVLFDSLVRTDSIPDATPIFVLHGNSLSNISKARILAFTKARRQEVSFVEVNDSLLSSAPVALGDHVSVATYFRLFLADLLPENIEEALYLDADLLVLKSIRSLFNLPIANAIAAVDHFSPAMSLLLWGETGGDYFQAGVLLINLRYWREQGLQKRFLEVLETNKHRIRFWDQCVLNLSIEGKWDRLPIYFNVCHGMLPLLSKSSYDNIHILHYDGKGKPWADGYFRKLAAEWHHAYQLTYGKAFRLGPNPQKWKKALLFYLYAEMGIKLKLAFWR